MEGLINNKISTNNKWVKFTAVDHIVFSFKFSVWRSGCWAAPNAAEQQYPERLVTAHKLYEYTALMSVIVLNGMHIAIL